MSNLSEVTLCGEQLLAVLVGDSTETTCLQSTGDHSQQLAHLRAQQQQHLKRDIQFLTSEMNMDGAKDGDTDSGIFSSSSMEDVVTMETNLQSQVSATRSGSVEVMRACEQMKEELSTLQRDQQALKEQRQSRKEAKTAALPLARCDVNLYSNITNLRWQFNSAPHEVKGYVCNNNEVKTFSLNSKEVSQFFITNHLWDLIEEDW